MPDYVLDWEPATPAEREKNSFYNVRQHPVIHDQLRQGKAFRTTATVLWKDPNVLDQGNLGECVGYGWAGLLSTDPIDKLPANVFAVTQVAQQIYAKAQQIN